MSDDLDLDDLEAELSDFAAPDKADKVDPRTERILAGFEEIQRFVEEQGRHPRDEDGRDIFERLYAVRLDRIRQQDDCRTIVAPHDHQGLLDALPDDDGGINALDDEALLAELADLDHDEDSILALKHVRPTAEKRAAEEIANRTPCKDFEAFKPLFTQVQKDIQSGVRETRPFELKAEIRPGAYFIVNGQIAYVAALGEIYTNPQGRTDARLRVIFDNGTESDMLMSSLQRALHKDDAGRRITDPDAGPLFASEYGADDLASGTIYVLRSNSDLDIVKSNRDVLHKIGVTGGDVSKRIVNAENDATYLLAGVEVVATYDLYNINRTKLENLIHRFFDSARLNIEIKDRFGKPVKPREWFLVPLYAIDEMVTLLKDGTLASYTYDVKQAKLVRQS